MRRMLVTGAAGFIKSNILGTHSLLKAVRRVWQIKGLAPDDHRFRHVSTDEVYGTLSLDEPAYTATTAYAPNSPYSASKASSDFLVRSYHHTSTVRTICEMPCSVRNKL